MLTRFKVTNFKNFEDTLVFDLTKINNYKFNQECVEKGNVQNALIYGHNATGKSNLGYAIFDLVTHLTSKNINEECYLNYINANSTIDTATFEYTFNFNDNSLIYSYTKKSKDILVKEKIEINGEVFAEVDRDKSSKAVINAKGAEALKNDIENSTVSIVSYINKNTFLDEIDENNKVFFEFINFVEHMLFFRSLDDGNRYMGHLAEDKEIATDIIEHGNVKKFETFLNKLGILCNLSTSKFGTKDILVFNFKEKIIPFYEIASSGTKSLSLFYFWFQRLEEEGVKLIFIDEFDAFYHFELSKNIVEILKELDIQVILTTHNTSLITNELLRPDCYFLINNHKIGSLSNLTTKELREAHNIEKMYKAGSFGV